ncbi:hypothetical protein N8Z16_00710 [bacterium]|nr:hypothetical protein [bacterium]
MKIAVCFYGLSRTFKKTFENIKKNLLDQPEHQIDIFISTWEEENIDVKSELTKLYNPKKIIVEKFDEKMFSGFNQMFREYPMLYKIKSVTDLAFDEEDYDIIFLIRFDVVYERKFELQKIKKNIFYYGHGVHDSNINKIKRYWRLRVFSVKDCYDIWSVDPQKTIKWPNFEYLNPFGDVLNYASSECMKKFMSKMQLLEMHKKKFENSNSIKIKNEYILRKILKYLPKSTLLFKFYAFLSKKLGFYVPYANGNEPITIKHFKPTLDAYQAAFNDIKLEVADMDYKLLKRIRAPEPK